MMKVYHTITLTQYHHPFIDLHIQGEDVTGKTNVCSYSIFMSYLSLVTRDLMLVTVFTCNSLLEYVYTIVVVNCVRCVIFCLLGLLCYSRDT